MVIRIADCMLSGGARTYSMTATTITSEYLVSVLPAYRWAMVSKFGDAVMD